MPHKTPKNNTRKSTTNKHEKVAKLSELTRDDIKSALSRCKTWSPEKLSEKTGYRASRLYSLKYKGRTYSAKGVVALACKMRFGALPKSFSGGVSGKTAAGSLLLDRGFKVTNA